MYFIHNINPLNVELNPICHLLALLGGATIVVLSMLRVNTTLNRILLVIYTFFGTTFIVR
jgi:hypothetical protein